MNKPEFVEVDNYAIPLLGTHFVNERGLFNQGLITPEGYYAQHVVMEVTCVVTVESEFTTHTLLTFGYQN